MQNGFLLHCAQQQLMRAVAKQQGDLGQCNLQACTVGVTLVLCWHPCVDGACSCTRCAVEPELSYALSQVLRMLTTWMEACSPAVQTAVDMDGFLSTLLQLATKQ